MLKKSSVWVSWILVGLGVGIALWSNHLAGFLEQQLKKNVAGIQMIVGAKGSPMQMVMCSLYHMDSPTGNIPYSEYERLKKNPQLKEVVPISVGDSYKGYRIIGTTPEYFDLYSAEIAKGSLFSKSMEVVIGAEISRLKGLKIGDYFHGSHGVVEGGESHDHVDYKVVGILQPTGTRIDEILITPLESVWESHHESGEREVTSVLAKFKNPMSQMTMPRKINEQSNVMAALPAIEVNRIMSITGNTVQFIQWLALLIGLLAVCSAAAFLYQLIAEQMRNFAQMLLDGGTIAFMSKMVLTQAFLIVFSGYVIGVALFLLMSCLPVDINGVNVVLMQHMEWQSQDLWLLVAGLIATFVSSFFPLLKLIKIDLHQTLQKHA